MVARKIFYGFVFCLLLFTNTFANQGNPYLNPERSKKGVDLVYNHAWDIVYEQPDSTIIFAELEEQLAKDIDYPLGMINAHYIKGYAYAEMNYFDRAAAEYYKGLDLIHGNNGYEFLRKKVFLLNVLGSSYQNTYGFDEAISYFEQALPIAKNINLKSYTALLHYNIGVCYRLKDMPEIAKEHYYRALSIYKELQDIEQTVKVYNLLGILYNNERQYDIAMQYLRLGLNICNENPDIPKSPTTWFLNNIGENYFKRGNFDQAKNYYFQALKISEELGAVYEIKFYNNNLGDIYLKEADYESAISYFKRSISFGNEEAVDDEYRRACESISLVYEKIGQYNNALTFKNKLIAQTKLLTETKDKLAEQNAQYHMREMEWVLERQQQQAQLLAMQAENFWFKFSISLLVIVLAYSAYKAIRYYRGIRAVKKWLATD